MQEERIHARRDLEIEAVGLDDKLPVGCKEQASRMAACPPDTCLNGQNRNTTPHVLQGCAATGSLVLLEGMQNGTATNP